MRTFVLCSGISMALLLGGCAGSGDSGSNPAALEVATASLPRGTVGSAYAATLAATGGTAPYAWALAAGALPAGVSLESTGTVVGTPSAAGVASFTVRVTDAATRAATKALSLDVAPAPSSGLLEGDPSASAMAALTFVDEIDGSAATEISDDPVRGPIARTHVLLQFRDDATVGQVNDSVSAVGGRIAWMTPDVPQLLVRFADPGTLAGVDAIISRLTTSPAVVAVVSALMPATDALPDGFEPPQTSNYALDGIDHLLSIRAAAAWNASGGLSLADPPTVLVADYFGDGPPHVPPYAARFFPTFQFSNTTYDLVPPDVRGHGYHVLGIIAADYGGDEITGAYAGVLDVAAVDAGLDPTPPPSARPQRMLSIIEIQATILSRLRLDLAGRRVVLNTSLGFPCVTEAIAAEICNETVANARGVLWADAVRRSGLEERVLHVAAAGNSLGLEDIDARFDSSWAAAALLPLRDPSGQAVPNLRNTVVVENLVNGAEPPFEPVCLFAGSKIGGDVSAVGTDVLSYLRPSLSSPVPLIGEMTGSSMAAPAVAGIAARAWAFAPDRSAVELAQLVRGTAEPSVPGGITERCQATAPAPPVDAYALLLRADRAQALATGLRADAPVRSLVLDVAGATPSDPPDGDFDGVDVTRFLEAFAQQKGDAIWVEATCSAYDWSRFDLNGDGRTGGWHADRFDLDMDGVFSDATSAVEGPPGLYAEVAVTDLAVLCYYAFSPLYQGSELERERLLGNRCADEGRVWIDGTWARTDLDPTADFSPRLLASDAAGNVFVAWSVHDSAAGWTYSGLATVIGRVDDGVIVPLDTLDMALVKDFFVDDAGNMILLYVPHRLIPGVGTETDGMWARRYDVVSGWGDPQFLVDAGNGRAPAWTHVAADARGNAIVAMTSQAPASTMEPHFPVQARRYDAELGLWEAPVQLDPQPPDGASFARVAMTPAGDAVVAWTGSDAAGRTVLARRYRYGQGWDASSTVIFSPNVLEDKALRVAMDGQGNAIVAAYAWRSGSWVMRLEPEVGWTAPQKVAANPDPGHDPHVLGAPFTLGGYLRLAMSDAGQAILVYEQAASSWDGGTLTSLWSRRYRPCAGWEPAELIEAEYSTYNSGDSGVVRGGLALGMHGPGFATIVGWEASHSPASWFSPYDIHAYARHYTPGVGWGEPSRMYVGTGTNTAPAWDRYYASADTTGDGTYYSNHGSHVDVRGDGAEVFYWHRTRDLETPWQSEFAKVLRFKHAETLAPTSASLP